MLKKHPKTLWKLSICFNKLLQKKPYQTYDLKNAHQRGKKTYFLEALFYVVAPVLRPLIIPGVTCLGKWFVKCLNNKDNEKKEHINAHAWLYHRSKRLHKASTVLLCGFGHGIFRIFFLSLACVMIAASFHSDPFLALFHPFFLGLILFSLCLFFTALAASNPGAFDKMAQYAFSNPKLAFFMVLYPAFGLFLHFNHGSLASYLTHLYLPPSLMFWLGVSVLILVFSNTIVTYQYNDSVKPIELYRHYRDSLTKTRLSSAFILSDKNSLRCCEKEVHHALYAEDEDKLDLYYHPRFHSSHSLISRGLLR